MELSEQGKNYRFLHYFCTSSFHNNNTKFKITFMTSGNVTWNRIDKQKTARYFTFFWKLSWLSLLFDKLFVFAEKFKTFQSHVNSKHVYPMRLSTRNQSIGRPKKRKKWNLKHVFHDMQPTNNTKSHTNTQHNHVTTNYCRKLSVAAADGEERARFDPHMSEFMERTTISEFILRKLKPTYRQTQIVKYFLLFNILSTELIVN